MQSKIHYIVEALVWGDRENHSYVVGLYDSLDAAKKCADDHSGYRGGKYTCQVLQCEMNSEVDTDWSSSLMYETQSSLRPDLDALRVRNILQLLKKSQ